MHNKELSIIVFGGTGFIGGNFSNEAADRGAQVIACGRSAGEGSILTAAVEVAELDATDLDAVLRLMRTVRPNAVVFGISRVSPRVNNDIEASTILTELRSLANVIQGAHECGVEQLVFCSSGGAIYGDSQKAHTETDLCSPKSLYGRLKIQAETLANTLGESLKIRSAILRIGNPYGPGQSPFGVHGVIPVFMHKMLTGSPITIFGSLEAAKDYVFVDDVSRAIWACIERQATGVFNVASGVPTTLRTLVGKISAACSLAPDMRYVELSEREVSSFTLDIKKAQRDLHWQPIVDLDSGIDATKRWIEKKYLRSP